MSDDEINITVDGKSLKARKGQMLIEVTDAAGIDIPRFCYHKKLSVAANCRMCLVEVEKAPKPLPACATPVMPDMVVKTTSETAIAAQKGTMEFLLINHPLDCPICDQGGECELQDVAMGYGGGVSQYTEGKRVVMDKYIGPLIATEMTRCIHCTRCVRFGEEIAGIRELGATGRGENVRIGTYIEKSVASEVSGNVIDVCPVGALTARPSRYSARSWELTQVPSIAPHDSVGSNIYLHLDNGKVNRAIPRENESVNEVWISDRDRFSYQGIDSADRIRTPMIRVDGELVETSWERALEAAANALKSGKAADSLGVLGSPNATLEELYLLQKMARSLGTANIDHRLGQVDFSHDESMPVMPWLGMSFDALETLDSALLVGSNIRKDQPIAALRLRKAALNGGAVSFVNPRGFEWHFDPANQVTCRYDQMTAEMLGIAKAIGADLSSVENLPASITVSEAHKQIAQSLKDGEKSAVILGNLATQHPRWSELKALGEAIAKVSESTLALLPERANTCGAWLAGVIPHRKSGGQSVKSGLNAAEMLQTQQQVYLTLGVEAEYDAFNPSLAVKALSASTDYVAIAAYMCDSIAAHATVVLPMGVFAESFGTWVNASGSWQSAKGAISPPGQARPGWKILRVLGDQLNLDGFSFNSPEEVSRELQGLCKDVELNNFTQNGSVTLTDLTDSGSDSQLLRFGETPIYSTDPLVRRSVPLQKTADAKSQPFAALSTNEAQRRGLDSGDNVVLTQSIVDGVATDQATLPVRLDDAVPDGTVWIPGGLEQTAKLGAMYAPIELTKA